MERQICALLVSAGLSSACSPEHFDKTKFSDSGVETSEDSATPPLDTADSGGDIPFVTDLAPWDPETLDQDLIVEVRELVAETLGENISPSGLTYDPSANELIITSDNPAWEFHVDANSGELVFALPLAGDPEGVTLLPDGRILRVNEDYREADPEVIASAFYTHGSGWENTLACIPGGGHIDEDGGMEGAAYIPSEYLPDRFAAPEGVILTVGEYSRSPYFDAAACMGEEPALTESEGVLRAGSHNYTGASFLEETGYVYLLSNDSSLGIDVYDPRTGRWVMNYPLPTLSDPDGLAVYEPDCTTGYASLAIAEGSTGQVLMSDQFPLVCGSF